MKLTELLIAAFCSIIVARSETIETDNEQKALLKRASEQLERLAPYRRISNQEPSDASSSSEVWRSPPPADQNALASDETGSNADQVVPWEILEILPDEQTEADATKQPDDDEKRIAIGILADPRYTAMMRERIKRGFDYGSASLLTSIAGGVLSGVASASSSSAAKASAGSSEPAPYHHTSYGPPPPPDYPAYPPYPPTYSYEAKPFGPWDFKKAIFSTLFQAIKAISGGVLALKGQLVKGGGYLLSAKGKVISKTGDVITSFGKHLASSISAHPKPEAYAYGPPPPPNIGHDSNYPPPHADDYSEANDYNPHGVPSNVVYAFAYYPHATRYRYKSLYPYGR